MKRHQALAIGICCGLALLQTHAATKTSELVYIGTRGTNVPPPGQKPEPQGIFAARLDTQTGHLTPLGLQVELGRATWLTMHPTLPVMYSVAASDSGNIADEANLYSFAVDAATGKLKQINKVGAGGGDATHLALDPASKTLFVADHATGDVTAVPLQSDGSLGKVVSSQKDFGTGPHRRQYMPQPHGLALDPSHRYLVTADFGADRLFVYGFDGKTRTLSALQPRFEPTPHGSGPRHPVFHPQGKFLYLLTELTADLRTYRWDAKTETLHLLDSFSPYPANYAGTQEKSGAEIGISHDGRFLYVSLRGDQNSIVVYSINQKTGLLKEVQRVAPQGKSPWSFAIDPTGRWMVVTYSVSNTVTAFRVNPTTGKLTPTEQFIPVPEPVTVAFYGK